VIVTAACLTTKMGTWKHHLGGQEMELVGGDDDISVRRGLYVPRQL